MKNYLKILIVVAIVGTLYNFRYKVSQEFGATVDDGVANFQNIFFPSVPCAEPIQYVLGTFDPKFKISKEYFLSALADAEEVWEKPNGVSLGKELFSYSAPEVAPRAPDDVLKVNLIYDYRQEATTKLASLGIVVNNTRASYDALKVKFESLKASYEKQKDSFNQQVATFNQKQKAYQDQVDYWNDKGGAPKKEYDELQATRASLEAESKTLQAKQVQVNNMAEEVNAMVVVLNRLITALNLSVDKYNTTNVSRGESFTEGVFYTDGVTKEIDIYEFSSREKLVRVLAHELGHALGLDHVADPKAIMYELNQGDSEALTPADLEALNTKCQTK